MKQKRYIGLPTPLAYCVYQEHSVYNSGVTAKDKSLREGIKESFAIKKSSNSTVKYEIPHTAPAS